MQIPDRAPFDSQGSMMSKAHPEKVGYIHPDSAEIFHPGIDFLIDLPNGKYQAYKDEVTARKIAQSDPLYTEPDWRDNQPFQATLIYWERAGALAPKDDRSIFALTSEDEQRVYWMMQECVDEMGTRERGIRISGTWSVVQIGEYYSLRLLEEAPNEH